MQIIFYKTPKATWVDRVVSWWTNSPYTHCELRFSDGENFSSSGRDGGVRFKYFDLKPGHWSIIDLNVTEAQERSMRRVSERYLGKKYDFLGILGFLYFRTYGHKDKWYCSEICAHVLNQERLIFTPKKISPADLKYVIEQVYETTGYDS